MNTQEGSRSCDLCGAARPLAGRCPGCGESSAGNGLRLLPPAAPGEGPTAPPPARLVRRLKMPTVEDLTLGSSDSAAQLQGAMSQVAAAIQEGDLANADERLERALGAVLSGPGDDEDGRRFNMVASLLWIWSLILLALFLVSLF